MNPQKLLSPVAASLLLVSCALADTQTDEHGQGPRGSPSNVVNKQQNIAHGQPATDDAAVFFVEVTTPHGTGTCSATLVTPDLLLTAAHCLSGQFGAVDCSGTTLTAALPKESFRVSNEPDLAGAADPSWKFPSIERALVVFEGELLCGHDIGLIQLTEMVSTLVAEPAKVPLDASATHYRAIGYGASHPSGTGERVRRTSGPLEIQCNTRETCEDTLITGAAGAGSISAPPIVLGEWIGQSAGCPGDSGGPALFTGDGDQVIGVLSRGSEDCGVNIYTSPQSPAFRAAVQSMISDHEFGKMYEIPSWALDSVQTPDPEGSAGGAGGRSDAPQTGGSIDEVASFTPRGHNGCSCDMIGRRAHVSSWYSILLTVFSILLGGARRRYAGARAAS